MPQTATITRPTLKTPRAAAVAGILFSALQIVAVWLFRTSIPPDPLEPGAWLLTDIATVAFALHLIPFVGIAFLWFIGVLRDHLGEMEDRFFATIFLGSALLYLAMLFLSAATIEAEFMARFDGPDFVWVSLHRRGEDCSHVQHRVAGVAETVPVARRHDGMPGRHGGALTLPPRNSAAARPPRSALAARGRVARRWTNSELFVVPEAEL